MTVVNDGLPVEESAAYDVDDTEAADPVAEPVTEQLPLGTTADQPTQALPLTPQPAPTGSMTDGSVAGDLFDGAAPR
jgi:hypothetical protein